MGHNSVFNVFINASAIKVIDDPWNILIELMQRHFEFEPWMDFTFVLGDVNLISLFRCKPMV